MMPKPRTEAAIVGYLLAFFGPEIKSWRGEQPLRKVFWGYGVLVSTALGLLYALSMLGDRIGLQQLLLPCMAVYTCWLLVSLWRSSKPEKNSLSGALARQLAVVWALNTILVLTFLQFELIERYLDMPSVHRVLDTSAPE